MINIDVYANDDLPEAVRRQAGLLYQSLLDVEGKIELLKFDPFLSRLWTELEAMKGLVWMAAASPQTALPIFAAVQQAELAVEAKLPDVWRLQERQERNLNKPTNAQSPDINDDPYDDNDDPVAVITPQPVIAPRFGFIGRWFKNAGAECATLAEAPAPQPERIANTQSALAEIIEASIAMTERRLWQKNHDVSTSLAASFNTANGPTAHYRPGLRQDNFIGMNPAALVA